MSGGGRAVWRQRLKRDPVAGHGTARGRYWRAKRQGGDRHSQRIEAHAELILSAVAARSDITLSELREQLRERGVAVAIGTLWRFFKRRKITRKKVGPCRRTAPQRGERGPREAWFEGQLDLDPTRIVFIDETAANTKMARLYGRAPRGERCRAAVPHGHWKFARASVIQS